MDPGAVVTLAGRANVSGASDGADGRGARFSAPAAIVTDLRRGFAYIADARNHCIRRLSLDTHAVDTVAGGSEEGGGGGGYVDGEMATAKFRSPQGIAVDPSTGCLYVADTQNNRLRKIDTATGRVSTVPVGVELSQPHDVAFSAGQLYIVDTMNHRVRVLNLTNAEVTTLAGSGVPGFSDGMVAQLNQPKGICVDESGWTFVSDSSNHRIGKSLSRGVGRRRLAVSCGRGRSRRRKSLSARSWS